LLLLNTADVVAVSGVWLRVLGFMLDG